MPSLRPSRHALHTQGDALIGGPLGSRAGFAEGVAETGVRQGLARLPEAGAGTRYGDAGGATC